MINELPCGSYPKYTHTNYVNILRQHCVDNCSHRHCLECRAVMEEVEYLQNELRMCLEEFNMAVLYMFKCDYVLVENIRMLTQTLRDIQNK